MGCLIALTCSARETAVVSAHTQTSRHTDPDACVSRDFEASPPQEWRKSCQKKRMLKPSKAEQVLGRIEKGVHFLERDIAVAHGTYRVGQALAPIAAAMV